MNTFDIRKLKGWTKTRFVDGPTGGIVAQFYFFDKIVVEYHTWKPNRWDPKEIIHGFKVDGVNMTLSDLQAHLKKFAEGK